MKEDVLEQVNDRINDDMISEVLRRLETFRTKKTLLSDTDKYRDKR